MARSPFGALGAARFCARARLVFAALEFDRKTMPPIHLAPFAAIHSFEYPFARLFGTTLGNKGKDWDAEVYRFGDKSELSHLLMVAAAEMERRVKRIPFSPQDRQHGGDFVMMEAALGRLREVAEAIATEPAEPQSSAWFVIGNLVLLLTLLLERLEESTTE